MTRVLNQLLINDTSFGSSMADVELTSSWADGSVQFVSEDIALDTLKSLASRQDGEVMTDNPF